MHLAFNSKAAKKNKACHTGDYDILYRMFLFLATVIFLLKLRIGEPENLPLRTIVNKREFDENNQKIVSWLE